MAEDRITAALRGPLPQTTSGQPTGQTDDEQGDGTSQSGYVTPDLGPFECSNCVHFDGQSRCNHPQVQSDPEVQGNVDPEGCCNFFKSSGNQAESGEQEQ